ncbi:hypothetical protein [Microbacterium sp.]|uniref:hypothetical protein n=1 Tax=Microbacterium sp. TaxID=51671 RepID=UPI003F6FB0A9
MSVRTMDAAPMTSRTAATTMWRRVRAARPRMPIALSMSETSETASPAAAMPCALSLTESGIMPRTTRLAPTDATEMRTAFVVRLPTSVRSPTGRTRP